jgi:AcrR family transcriptional regulator
VKAKLSKGTGRRAPRKAAPKRGKAPAAHTSKPARPAIARAAGGSRRAARDRGAETRNALVEAALDAFGRLGFEGASTREIAKAAGANLAAIVYHFGSKEELHLAVARYIVERVQMQLGPVLASLRDPASVASPEVARATLGRVIATLADVLVGTAEAERWARFIVREQMQPTAAFDVIYGLMGNAHGLAVKLAATATGRPENETMMLRVFTLMGQVLVFRVAQALVLRRTGWQQIGDAERARIKAVIAVNLNAILDSEVKS